MSVKCQVGLEGTRNEYLAQEGQGVVEGPLHPSAWHIVGAQETWFLSLCLSLCCWFCRVVKGVYCRLSPIQVSCGP